MDKRVMVGDWFRATTNEGEKDIQVNAIDMDGWIIFSEGATNNYEPIGINDRYLGSVGFIEDENLPYLLHLYNDANTPIMTMEKRESVFICTYKVRNNIGKIEIEYIHQFQHLCNLLGVSLMPTEI